jgi:hypothetical protein
MNSVRVIGVVVALATVAAACGDNEDAVHAETAVVSPTTSKRDFRPRQVRLCPSSSWRALPSSSCDDRGGCPWRDGVVG